MKKSYFVSFLTIVLSLCIIMGSMPIVITATETTLSTAWNGSDVSTKLEGNGSEETPYLIKSAADLKYLADNINNGTLQTDGKFFLQTADIDLNKKEWMPIGLTSSRSFKGTYDGGYHTISNLYISESGLVYNGATYYDKAGLFGMIWGNSHSVTIKNLSIDSGEIISEKVTSEKSGLDGLWKVGAVCALALNLELKNVYTNVDIKPSYNSALLLNNTTGAHNGVYAGGLIGEARGQTSITNCIAEGEIFFSNDIDDITTDVVATGTTQTIKPRYIRIGGLVGQGTKAGYSDTERMISHSYYTGTIDVLCNSNNAETRVGGIAGVWTDSATIDNTYMLGSMNFKSTSANQGNYNVGLIVGRFGWNDTTSKITNTVILNSYANIDDDNFVEEYEDSVGASASTGEISVNRITNDLTDEITIRHYQEGASTDSSFNIRLLSSIGHLDYRNVGYQITALYNGNRSTELTHDITTVYKSIIANKIPYSASEISNGEDAYIVPLAINEIPKNGIVALEITTFVNSVDEASQTVKGNTTVMLFNSGKFVGHYGEVTDDYIVTCSSDANETVKHAAKMLANNMKLFFAQNDISLSPKRVIVGDSSRQEFSAFQENLNYNEYAIAVKGKTVFIAGTTNFALLDAVDHFCEAYLSSNNLTLLKKDYLYRVSPTYRVKDISIDGKDISDYCIVYSNDTKTGSRIAAADLYRYIGAASGIELPMKEYSTDPDLTDCIVIGINPLNNYGDCSVYAQNGTIYVDGDDIVGLETGVSYLASLLTASESVSLDSSSIVYIESLLDRSVYAANSSKFQACYRFAHSVSADELNLEHKINLLNNPQGRTMIIAHRAEHTYYPENSLEAVISAWLCGADAVEIDIQKTKDGHWICMHDETLTRTTNVESMKGNNGLPDSIYIEDWTLEQLRQLRLIDSYGQITPFLIPTLEEVLIACDDRIFVHLDKTFDWVNDIFPIMEKVGVYECVYLVNHIDYENTLKLNSYFEGVKLHSVTRTWSASETAETAQSLWNNSDVITPAIIPLGDYEKWTNVDIAAIRSYVGKLRIGTWVLRNYDYEYIWRETQSIGCNILLTDYPIVLLNDIKAH